MTSSIDALAEELYPYAKDLVRGFTKRFGGLDYAEIESGAMLGVAHALRSYDAEKGPLLPHARRYITHYVLEAVRRETGYRERRHLPPATARAQAAYDGLRPCSACFWNF